VGNQLSQRAPTVSRPEPMGPPTPRGSSAWGCGQHCGAAARLQLQFQGGGRIRLVGKLGPTDAARACPVVREQLPSW
jgi:hypothetical protein